MRRIALTGGIATGKSHVRARFETLGVPTIDADVLARAAVAPGSPALHEILRVFGTKVLSRDGTLDRRSLGARVFADPEERRVLEHIIHPEVLAAIDRWFSTLPAAQPLAIADIPLLYEVGGAGAFERVIVAACDSEQQVRRVMARDGLSESDARARVAAQLPIADKVARADYVIDTNGTVAETNRQVDALCRELSALPFPPSNPSPPRSVPR
jgi:dephospho-CoA kinase